MAVRFAIWFFVAMTVSMPPSFAQEEPTDGSLRIYAVNIIQDPPQSWTGYGVYLGSGLVLTAAHVVGSAARTRPSVRIAGLVLRTTAVKEGAFEREDLTLLRVDERQLPVSLRLRRMPVCQRPPWVGQPVVVAVPEGTARSRIMSPQLLPAQYRARFSTAISDVATTGNSGSGVFDEANKCLLGIMSRKIQVRPEGADPKSEYKDLAKYFVPAAAITAFLPSQYHF